MGALQRFNLDAMVVLGGVFGDRPVERVSVAPWSYDADIEDLDFILVGARDLAQKAR